MKGATSIQERLWELRKDKGLNLEELSKLTGISKSALGSYEKEDYKEINHGNHYHHLFISQNQSDILLKKSCHHIFPPEYIRIKSSIPPFSTTIPG